MKPAKPTLLLHPLFLVSTALLFLNDAFWKAAYHNALTGKLSDAAGLIVLPLLLTALFPRRKRLVFALTTIGFTWWKLDLSQPFIEWMATNAHLHWARVVDPTDLYTLAVLPVAWRCRPVMAPTALPGLRPSIAVVALGVLCADQPPHYMTGDNDLMTYRTFTVDGNESDLLSRLRQKGIGVLKDTGDLYELDRYDLYLLRPGKDSAQWLALKDHPELKVYRKSYSYGPTYIIPTLLVNGDTLRRIRFWLQVDAKKNKAKVMLTSFYIRPFERLNFSEQKRAIRRYGKPLKKRLKELLEP